MSLRRLWAVAVKEYNHIMRDPITLGLVLLAPTLVLFLMGFAMTVNIQHVPIAVLDYDHSPTSRAFIQRMTAGDDLDLIAQVTEFVAKSRPPSWLIRVSPRNCLPCAACRCW